MAVVVPFESPEKPSIDPLVDLVSADMDRVNSVILTRTGSEVTMIPEVANHLISSGGKRLRPMLTLALARLTGYGGAAAKLGKNVGDDFREGKITLPVVLTFRRGGDAEREFWRRTLERGEATDSDLEHAIGLMIKHRALEDSVGRAHHSGAIARDALAQFPDSKMKSALAEAVDFCIARTH